MRKWAYFLAILSLMVYKVDCLYTVVIQVSPNLSSGSLAINYMILQGSTGISPLTNINTDSQGVLNKAILADGNLAVLSNLFPNDYGVLNSATIGNYGDSLSMTSLSILDVVRSTWNNKTFTGNDGFVQINSSNAYTYIVNGGWGDWSSWSVCSTTCGGGNQSQQRKCNNPPPANGGAICSGLDTNYAMCNSFICPVDGVWLQWNPWSPCSLTCGTNATQTRTRDCQPPSNGGQPCVGDTSATQTCTTLPSCPVNGAWCPWSAWSACSTTCNNGGIQNQNRTCNCPTTAFGGTPCQSGSLTQTQVCNINVPCPIDGQWSSWTAWSTCSVTCGQTGNVTRNRNCNNPSPLNGGKYCVGTAIDFNNCTNITANCPVNGVWGTWLEWSACSSSCGSGTKTRNRNCDSPAPQYSGLPCSSCITSLNGTCGLVDQESSTCNLTACISIEDLTKNLLSNAMSLLNISKNSTMSDKDTMNIAFNVVNQVKNALMSQLSNSSTPVMVDTKSVTVGLANLNPNSTTPLNMTSSDKGGISMGSMNNISVAGVVQFSALQASTFFKNATASGLSTAILSLGIVNASANTPVPMTLSMPNQNGQSTSKVMTPVTFYRSGQLIQTLQYQTPNTVFQLSLDLTNTTNFTMWFSMKGILPNVSTDADAIVTLFTTTGLTYQSFPNLNLQVDFSGNPLLSITIPPGQINPKTNILIEMFTQPTNNSNDTATIQLGVTSITPLLWNTAVNAWQDVSAQVDGSSNINKVVFKSNFLGTFSTKIFIPPNMINFKDVFSNFAALLANSFVVLIVLILLIIGYILLGILMWRKDRREALLLRYEPLLDNDPENEYTYVLSIYTSECGEGGTSSDVFVNILGKWGSSSHRKMQDGYRTNIFSSGSVCKFVMTTETSLGDLLALRVWHNSSGPRPAWHLEKIIIEDMQTKKMYIFMCDTWLAEDRFDGKVERVLVEIKKDQKFQDMFYRRKVGGSMDKHVMLTLTKNTGASNYTRLQKLSVFVTMFFLIMVTNAMFFGKDAGLPAEANFSFNLGIISLTWFQIYTGLISVGITYPCIFLASEIFRRTKRWNRRWTEDEEIKMKNEFKLPKGFVVAGWMLLFVAMSAAIFFTFLYSLAWGNDKSSSWLQSFFLGIFGMVLFTDPIILLFIYILATKLFGAASQNSEINIDSFINDDMKKIIGASVTEPDPEKLEQIRKDKKNSEKLSTTIQDALTYVMYLLLLISLAYDARDSNIYQQNNILKSIFSVNTQSVIKTYNDIYPWANSILNEVYPLALYNQANRTGDLANSIHICDCMRQGPFRLRQVRVRRNTCSISSYITQAYGNIPCNENINPSSEDFTHYSIMWSPFNASQASNNNSNLPQTPLSPAQAVIDAFRYQNVTESGGYPFDGKFGTYEGGGYVAVLGTTQDQAAYVISNLNQTLWIDKLSRGVFFEGTVYNWNTNLFSTIQVLFETPNSGGTFVFPAGVRTYRLYDYTPGKMIVLLTMQCLYLLIVLISIYREIRKIFKLRGEYMSDSWNKLEIISILLSICIIITTTIRIMFTIDAVTKLNNNKGSYVSFDDAAMWVETTCILMAISVFISILRILKYFGFNKYVAITQATLVRAWEQLSSFAFAMAFFLVAYICVGQILYSLTNLVFSDLLVMLRNLIAAFLGMVNLSNMFEVTLNFDNMLYYFTWCFLSMFFLTSVFIAILSDTYSDILEKDLYEYDKELVDHMWTRFIKLGNSIKLAAKSSIPTGFTKKTIIAPVDMDDVDIMMGSKESVRQFSQQRINSSVRRKLAELNREKLTDIGSTRRNKETGNEIYINPISFTDINLAGSNPQLFGGDDSFVDRIPRFKGKGNVQAFSNKPMSVIQPTRPVMKPTQTIDFLPKTNARQRRSSRNKTVVLKDNSKSNSHI